jgi:hypothetical protein
MENNRVPDYFYSMKTDIRRIILQTLLTDVFQTVVHIDRMHCNRIGEARLQRSHV